MSQTVEELEAEEAALLAEAAEIERLQAERQEPGEVEPEAEPKPRRRAVAYSSEVIEAARMLQLPQRQLQDAGKAWVRSAARDPSQVTMFVKNDSPAQSWAIFRKAAGLEPEPVAPPEHIAPTAPLGPKAAPGRLLVYSDGTHPVDVGSLADASIAVRTVTDTVGSTAWYDSDPNGATLGSPPGTPISKVGDVYDDTGNLVARVSYNGRVWGPSPSRGAKTPEITDLGVATLTLPPRKSIGEKIKQALGLAPKEEPQAAAPAEVEAEAATEAEATSGEAEPAAEAEVAEAQGEATAAADEGPSTGFVSEVRQVGQGVGAAGRMGLNRVYLSALYAKWPDKATESKPEFFERLGAAHRDGSIKLSTVALTGAVDKKQFEESALTADGKTYHFLND